MKNIENLRFSNILSRLLIALCLMMTSISAWAQTYYVFRNTATDRYYMTVNNNALARNDGFDPAKCLWTLDGTTLSTTISGTTYILGYDRSGWSNYSFSNWGVNRGYTAAMVINGTTASCTVNNRSNGNGTNTTAYVRYASNAFGFATTASNYAIAQEVQITTVEASLTQVTISGGSDEMSAIGNTTFSHNTCSYQAGYTNYRFGNADHLYNASGTSITSAPASTTNGITYTWSIEGADGYASVDASGVVNYSALIPERERTITLKCVAKHTASGLTTTATKEITLVNTNMLYSPSISYDNAAGGNVSVTLSYPESDPEVKLYYTTDGSNPSSSSTEYTGPFEVASNTTIKVIAVKSSQESAVVSAVVENITTGVANGKVVLDDREDHTWTYYAGVNPEVDDGHYNDTYKASGTGTRRNVRLYSPNPRNVKITYNGVNGIANSEITVKVSTRTGEDQTSFVYYITLEEGATAGQYPYQVISNPFSVRPSTGTGNGKVYYGFNGWKIVSGGEYINGYSNKQTLPLDAEITFVNLPYPSVNCTSAEIVFETTWTQANVQYGGGNVSNAAFNGGNYEKNFCVINANYTNALAPTYPVTITSVEPDGSASYDVTFSNLVTPAAGANNMTKLEYMKWNPSSAVDARGRNLTIGRGMQMNGTRRALQGCSAKDGVNHTFKVESGKYNGFLNYGGKPTSITKQIVILGNDYDRAKKDWTGSNNTLDIQNEMDISTVALGSSTNTVVCRVYIKSGKFVSNKEVGNATAAESYYFGFSGQEDEPGYRYLEIQGGELCNIAGGMGKNHSADLPAVHIRMKGGHVRGSIYGAAQFASASGQRWFVFTGGEVNGWVAGGANGTFSTKGDMSGNTYVYIGGTTTVNSNDSQSLINSNVGGNVFGAGCGYNVGYASGKITGTSNVVLADNAYVERGIYGGGAFGYAEQESYVYITGGHVEGKVGGATFLRGTLDRTWNAYSGTYSYSSDVIGGVYGGACQNDGVSSYIYMTGGLVEGGLYGASNTSGTLSDNVNMQINGGQVGTNTKSANIHGGGYGQSTVVTKNVDITLGKTGAARDADGVVVYGDVYGGSALGSVNGTSATNDYHTNVTMNAGTINGSLYGGALGSNTVAANVYGPVSVTVNGGLLRSTDQGGLGAVFGCNNMNGRPQGKVTVDVTGGEMEYIYGGGNAAPYTVPTPNSFDVFHVQMSGGLVHKHVFGGGLGSNAVLTGNTEVKVTGGSVVEGNVYGGGNGALVTGDTHVVIGE